MDWQDRRSGAAGLAGDVRSPYGVDYGRVIHSGSFRRLQGKTQILAIGDGDFHRTRLTHSLETAQIAEGIVERLGRDVEGRPVAAWLPPSPLIRAVALAHDLGHPPFGHSGEVALDLGMAGHGGFEGNGQTLRILSRLESFSDGFGSDLTRRAMLGVLKYPVAYSDAVASPPSSPAAGNGAFRAKPPKCYFDTERDVVEWLLAPLSAADREAFLATERRAGGPVRSRHHSFDCTMMEIADDIAYGIHDLEDALALELVDRERLAAALLGMVCEPFVATGGVMAAAVPATSREGLLDGLFGGDRARKRTIGSLVHWMIGSVAIVDAEGFESPLLRHRATLSAEARALLDALQSVVASEVIDSAEVQQLEFKGRRMVAAVFDAYCSSPSLLPARVRSRVDGGGGAERAICDHMAAMTDETLVRTYERLFSPRIGSVFDRI